MALVETYVDPDGTGDYTSLNAWEAAEQTDLVTAGDSHKVWCESSSGTADATTVDVSGWTTGVSNTITIQAAEGHEASTEWDATKYRLGFNTTSNNGLRIGTGHVSLKNLQLTGTTGYSLVVVEAGYADIDGCHFKDHTNTNLFGVLATYSAAASNFTVKNCILNGSSANRGIYNSTLNACILYNNTVINQGSDGIECVAQGSYVVNNISFDNTGSDFDLNVINNGDYNFSKDDTAPGTNSIHGDTDGKTPDFVSTTSGSEDFNLQSSSDAISAGIGPSSDANVPTTDINGETRSGTTCDIGAAEYVAAVTNLLTNYYYTHLMQGGL